MIEAAKANSPSIWARCVAWAALLAIVAGTLGLAAQRVAAYRDRDGELTALRERLATAQARRANPKPLEAALAALRATSVASAGYIDAPDQIQAASTFEQIVTGLAATQQVPLTSLQRLPVVADGPATALRLQIGTTVTTALVQPLVREIERSQPAIIIDAMTIERGVEGAIQAKFTLRAFWVPPA